MTPQAPMRHTVRAGIVCAVLTAALGLLGIGVGIGGVLEHHAHQCAVGR